MKRTAPLLTAAALVFFSVYVVDHAVSQSTPNEAPAEAQPASGPPAAGEASTTELEANVDLLLKRLGEPSSKRDSLYDLMVRRFNDMDKRFDKIERELKQMSYQVDRIESRR